VGYSHEQQMHFIGRSSIFLAFCLGIFPVFPTATTTVSFTYRFWPSSPPFFWATLRCLNDLRHFCQLPDAHTHLQYCLFVCFCVCVGLILALNKPTHKQELTWPKGNTKMPHTFVFIMLNVSWGLERLSICKLLFPSVLVAFSFLLPPFSNLQSPFYFGFC